MVLTESEVLEQSIKQDRERTQVATDLANWLVRYRSKHHLTQTELAKKMGCTQPVVARLELGDYEPRLATLRNLARLLDVAFTIRISPEQTRTRITPELSA